MGGLRSSSFSVLLIRLGALVASCGGPLVVHATGRGLLDDRVLFALTFAPVGFIVVGALTLRDQERASRLDQVLVGLGLVGVAGLTAENAFAIWQWVEQGSLANPVLVGVGIAIGTISSLGYGVAARSYWGDAAPRSVPSAQGRGGGSDLDAWAVTVIGLSFVTLSLFILPRNPRLALLTLLFFGACAAMGWTTLRRRRNYRDPRRPRQRIVGGVRYRTSRARLTALFGGGAAFCGALAVLGEPFPPWLVGVLWLLAGAGGILTLGGVFGWLPETYLELRDRGLVVGSRGATVTVPWDSISGVAAAEIHDNPVLLVRIADLETLHIAPTTARERTFTRLRSNERWVGAPLMLMTSHLGLDLPSLVEAVTRYAREPEARVERGPAGFPS